jgi:hypothetical protein
MGLASNPEFPLPWHSAPSIAPGRAAEAAPDRAWLIGQMVARVRGLNPQSGADALRELRRAFPDSPLGLRVNALEIMSKRRR